MILTGREHINAEMVLEPGDSFRIGIMQGAPNRNMEMLAQNGKWLTVTTRSTHKSKYYSGYYYQCKDSGYSWYWFHIQAIERADNQSPKASILTAKTLPNI